MAYLGVSMIVRSFRKAAFQPISVQDVQSPARRWTAFPVGTWTNLLNPNVGVFYIATIPQFIPEGASALGMGLLLAGIHATLGMVWFVLIIVGASYARRWLAHARALRTIDRLAGAALIGFGAKLALDHR